MSSTLPQNFVLHIDRYQIAIKQYLGQYSHGVDYYDVEFQDQGEIDSAPPLRGLLRAGSPDSGLAREIELRKVLERSQMLIDVLATSVQLLESASLPQSACSTEGHYADSSETPQEATPLASPYSEISALETLPLEASDTSIQSSEATQSDDLLVTPTEDVSDQEIVTNELITIKQKTQEGDQTDQLDSDKVENEWDNILERGEPPKAGSDSPNIHDVPVDNAEREPERPNQTNQAQSDDYLEEEFFPEQQVGTKDLYESEVLLLLSQYPENFATLSQWISNQPSILNSISTLIQVCQFCLVLSQNNWCLTHINPEFVYLGKPIRFLDLADVYPIGTPLQTAIEGDYCPPELSYGNLDCQDSIMTYLVGALLYHCLYHQKPPSHPGVEALELLPQPLLHQILTICLSSHPEKRFPVAQLRDLLVSTRQTLNQQAWRWTVAGQTTVGLSVNRLQNEDSYGIKQAIVNQQQCSVFAVADGMGGMAQGEVASRLAIETILDAPFSQDLLQLENCETWLRSRFDKANHTINNAIKNGGTTLSVALAVGSNLWIGHVGDSRIYYFRNHQLQQLSEDHSMVAMLVASGEITKEEATDHPDSNVLLKALGSTSHLSDGYVQVSASVPLEAGDLLLLCSDGVWGLLNDQDLTVLMDKSHDSLDAKAEEIISHVLKAGASDNATVVIAQVTLSNPSHLF